MNCTCGKLPPAIVSNYPKVILLDPGHAKSTAGKRSALLEDGSQFFEYEFNRDVVKRISTQLDRLGIKNHIIVPEVDYDVPLSTRAARANEYCNQYGKDNCILISVHSNAAGMGDKWMTAKGWSVYTTVGLTDSDKYADIVYKEAESLLVPMGFKMRPYLNKDGYRDWESGFTILVRTACPAILTENLFYDNKEECKFLMSDEGRQAIADLHINAIKKFN